MAETIFLLSLIIGYTILFKWSFAHLPEEKWQILATLPYKKTEDGEWIGINFTYYGLFTAISYVISIFMFMFLLASIGIKPTNSFFLILIMLVICIPSSRLIAYLVEGKRYNFTVGGASFIGIILAPILLYAINKIDLQLFKFPFLETLAAMAIAYAFGEGTGRLACISFGCCYGKPVSEIDGIVKKFFEKWHFVFTGKTKKAVYAGGLENVKLIPIQAITAILNISIAIIATILFLYSYFVASILFVILFGQLWRFISEFLRSDYRGSGNISIYQKMSLISIFYLFIVVLFNSTHSFIKPDFMTGFEFMLSPENIIFLEIIGIINFIYTAKSSVTGSIIRFHVIQENI